MIDNSDFTKDISSHSARSSWSNVIVEKSMDKQLTNRKFLIEIGLILVLLVDLFIQVLPIIPLSLLILLYVVVRANYLENTFLCMLCFPSTVGFVMNSLGMKGVGGWLVILGFVLLIWGYVTGRLKTKNIQQSAIPLIALFALFIISALTSSGGDYAMIKVRTTIIKGSIAFVGYLIFFSNYTRINVLKIGLDYVLLVALLLRLSLIVNGIPGPTSIMDFSFLRYQTRVFASFRDEAFIIDYQNIGFLCVQGIGFFLMAQNKKMSLEEILVLISAGLVVLYTGSRQAIVSFVLLFAFWSLLIRRGDAINKLFVPLLAGLFIFVLMQILFSEGGALFSVAEEGYLEGGGRGPWLMSGIQQFLENPVFGVGYGRFLMWGDYGSYPHNLFVELLCETGVIGFAIAIIIMARSLLLNKTVFRTIVYLFLALFLRSMASGGLDTNIALFSLLFAMSAYKETEVIEKV